MRTLFVFLFVIAGYNCFGQLGEDTIHVSKDMFLIKLSKNAYMHVSYSEILNYGRISSNGLIFIDNKKAFLFDTPATDSLTAKLVFWVEDSMKTKIVGFVPNHWHRDCMGGLGFLQKRGIPSYANQITIDIAKSKGLPVPEHGFKDSLKLKLNGELIECYYLGAAHSLDNIVVWIPSEKILFPGCMIKSLESNTLGNTVDGDLKSYPKTVDRLIEKFPSAKIIIPGHGCKGGIELLKHTKELVNGN